MEFQDKDVSLKISELDSKDKITISMEDLGDHDFDHPFLSIDLSEEEFKRLHSWLGEAVKKYDKMKQAP